MTTTFRMISTKEDPEGFYYSEQHDPDFDPKLPEHKYDNPRMMLVSNFPELEVTYSNVNTLLGLVGLENEPNMGTCGKVEYQYLHGVMRRLIQLLASAKQRKPMVTDDKEDGNFYHQGNDDDRVYRYIVGLMDVVNCCLEDKRSLTWV